ncbi:MAG TPA: excinuclease ABC subunit UvrB, partial [Xanthobacteraceae bacterium]|nr:excinuclease ABC subunit UvrB [Xanthobacteraceae bacterium]
MSKPPKPRTPKDPARPTRAKAARPPTHPIGPALADLLNPAINRGEAGVGSQTGLQPPPDNSRDRRADFSAAHRARKSTPAEFGEVPQSPYRDNAELREASPELARALGLDGDESDAGHAPSPSPEGAASRAEAREGAGGRDGVTTPQRSSPPPGPLRGPTSPLQGEVSEQHVVHGDRDTTVRRPRPARPELGEMGVAATANSLDKLLREGRREFLDE